MFFKGGGINEGEKLAAEFLRKNGYKIITQNWKVKFGEVDIIAQDKDVLVFVEVKHRKNTDFGRPADFVFQRKQHKIKQVAALYIMKNKISCNVRFDVVEVIGYQNIQINHIKNAFRY